MQMSRGRSGHPSMRMRAQDVKWPRGLRLTVALGFAAVSWAAIFGVTYLIVQAL